MKECRHKRGTNCIERPSIKRTIGSQLAENFGREFGVVGYGFCAMSRDPVRTRRTGRRDDFMPEIHDVFHGQCVERAQPSIDEYFAFPIFGSWGRERRVEGRTEFHVDARNAHNSRNINHDGTCII